VFLIHYVGLAHSPLKAIGWASIFADLGGLLVMLRCSGISPDSENNFFRCGALSSTKRSARRCESLRESTACGRSIPGAARFLHGGYYAAVDLYRHEALDYSILLQISSGATTQSAAAVQSDWRSTATYKRQGSKIAAALSIIEFGLLSMLLGFFFNPM